MTWPTRSKTSTHVDLHRDKTHCEQEKDPGSSTDSFKKITVTVDVHLYTLGGQIGTSATRWRKSKITRSFSVCRVGLSSSASLL